MKSNRHGISIGIERGGSEVFISLKAIGKLTHEDYENLNPFIDSALAGVGKPIVNILVDGSEFEGWELRAVWDDFRLGLKHGKEFQKIALYGDKEWLNFAARVGAWFTSGEIKHFSDYDEALSWLSG